MQEIKVLVLTDHSGHSQENSIYALLREMQSHGNVHSVTVCSRAVPANTAFFQQEVEAELYGAVIDENFAYSDDGKSFTKDLTAIDKDAYQLVFLRLPRPVSDTFLLSLEDQFPNAVLVNRPKGIVQTSSKAYLVNFKQYCAPIELVYSVARVLELAESMPIVLKPLKEYGGKGLLRIQNGKVDDGQEMHDAKEYLVELASGLASDGYLAMKFLKNVREGDKRIIVVDGEILACSLRLPAEGSWLCNIAQGGTSVASEVTEREKEIIAGIAPSLRAEGVLIFGADTLVDDDGRRVLSEINTLSIGGFPQAEAQSGKPIIKITIQKIIDYAMANQ